MSDEKEPLEEVSESGIFGYEYDANGNTIKVWRIRKSPKQLEREIEYDHNNLRIIEKSRVFNRDGTSYISVRTFERDEDGNILKIVTVEENQITNIEIHKHEKYDL